MDNTRHNDKLMYGMWGGVYRGWWKCLLDRMCWRDILRWPLAVLMDLGNWAWPGGEETCVYGLGTGINDGNKAGPVKELYQGGECAHMIQAICEHVCL